MIPERFGRAFQPFADELAGLLAPGAVVVDAVGGGGVGLAGSDILSVPSQARSRRGPRCRERLDPSNLQKSYGSMTQRQCQSTISPTDAEAD